MSNIVAALILGVSLLLAVDKWINYSSCGQLGCVKEMSEKNIKLMEDLGWAHIQNAKCNLLIRKVRSDPKFSDELRRLNLKLSGAYAN